MTIYTKLFTPSSGLEFAQARYQNPVHGRFTSVDPLTASASIKNPQSFNRYTYALNSPYKFVDPLGLLSEQTTGACGNRCKNSDSSAFSGGSMIGSSYGMGENAVITLALNIVFDASQMSLEAAKSAMSGTINYLQETFGAINVAFAVSYTEGAAEIRSKNHAECADCAFKITKGAVAGAVNVFLHSNSHYTSPISYFAPSSGHIFFEQIPGLQFPVRKLAHEVGHFLRMVVNGDPRTGSNTRGNNGAEGSVDSANYAEDSVINGAIDQMRAGGVRYGADYVDDYTKVGFSNQITPGRTAAILGTLAPRHYEPRAATPLDIFRLGALRASQR